jgi:hypothetical protein
MAELQERRGRDEGGKLAGARIYDDADPPLGPAS